MLDNLLSWILALWFILGGGERMCGTCRGQRVRILSVSKLEKKFTELS